MALDKQGYNIPFGQGLSLKGDPNQVTAGKFLGLQNVVFDTDNLLKKRNGFGLYASLPSTTSTTITTLNGNLLATGSTLQAYSQDTQQWIARGNITPVNLSVVPLVRTSASQTQCDSVTAPNGLVCSVNYDNTSKCFYSLSDSVTGQAVVPLTQLVATATSPKVFLFQSYFIITYLYTSSGTHLGFVAIPINNPTMPVTGLSTNDISTQVGSLASGYDAVVSNASLWFAWDSSDGGGGIRVTTLNSSLRVASSTLIAGKTATLLSAAVDVPNSRVWFTWYDGTANGYSTAYNNNGTVYLAPTQVFSTLTIPQFSTIVVGTALNIVYEISKVYTGTSTRSDNLNFTSITPAGSVSSPTVIVRSVGLASKLFTYNSVVYMLSVYAGALQPTYFLMDLNGNIFSRLAGTNAVGYVTGATLPSVTVNGATAQMSYLVKTQLTAVNKTQGVANVAGIYAQAGVNLASFTINATAQYSSEIAQNLHLTGGFLWQYDGVKPVEHNFHVYPEDLTATATTGGSMAVQSYFYVACYEWTDAQGMLHRSAPSVPLAGNVGAGNSANTVVVPTLRLTYKTGTNPVRIVLYRWSAAQPNYFQVTSVTAPGLNSVTTDTLTYVDTQADNAILGNELLYTTGSVVEDGAAPASSASTLFGSRLWLVNAENRNELWFSKQVLSGTPVEMSPLFTRYVAPSIGAQGSSGGITALAAMDDKLIIFKGSSLYYMTGVGPDNTGAQSDFSNAIYITGSVGCSTPNSIVLTPYGIMFQSDKGIWLLGRDLSTKYIGKEVQTYNSDTVLSAVCVPGTNQVRFVMLSGVMLMYDYDQDQWGTFVGAPALSSCLYNGLHTLLNKFGLVLQETPGAYLDNSSPVLISWKSAWLKLTNLQGFQRAYFMYMLSTYISPHKLNVQVAYDYDNTAVQSTIVTPTNTVTVYGADPVYGASSTYGGGTAIEQQRVYFKRQTCQAIQITCTELYDSSKGVAAGAGLTMSGINLVFAGKKSYPRIKAANSAG